jgi:hypothetical protein
MKSVGSHGSSLLLFIMKVHVLSDSNRLCANFKVLLWSFLLNLVDVVSCAALAICC